MFYLEVQYSNHSEMYPVRIYFKVLIVQVQVPKSNFPIFYAGYAKDRIRGPRAKDIITKRLRVCFKINFFYHVWLEYASNF
jgi:hypothetical protein